MAIVGEQPNGQGGTKPIYRNMGSMFKNDQGKISLKIDSIPVGDGWNGWVQVFDLDGDRAMQNSGANQQQNNYQQAPQRQAPQQQAPQRQASAPAGNFDDFDDDIPF